ncbi:hypothetical protein G9E11_06635 [Arthrobacter sp. IA7]|nr:hypothetical protein [Arthrobacter ipis]
MNPALFFGPYPLSEMRRKPLLAKWYRINALRLAASAVALAAIDRARTASLIPGSTPGGQRPPMYKRATAG